MQEDLQIFFQPKNQKGQKCEPSVGTMIKKGFNTTQYIYLKFLESLQEAEN